jgi:hypothetical protein
MKRVAGILLTLMVLAPSTSATDWVTMEPVRHLRKGVTAWLLIGHPGTDAERSINEQLSRLNDKMLSELKECDKNYREMMKEDFGKERMGGELTKRFDHRLRVTMRGPKYVSEVADVVFYCGGAHPYVYTDVAVFDLDTGAPVVPSTLLAPSANATQADESPQDGALESSTVFPALLPIYEELTRHDCDDVIEQSKSFLIWPDEGTGHVVVQPDQLPGAAAGCGVPAQLTLDQARKLGFDDKLLNAIDQGHRHWMAASQTPKR